MTKTPKVNFPGFEKPSLDFQPVRDMRRASLLYVDVDLTSARSVGANTQLVLPIAGNSFYVDQDPANGNATVHFQDTTLGNSDAPVFVLPGFIARVPYTQIMVLNAAQPGKRLRIFYGVDVDFVAGMNASISLTSAVPVITPWTNTQKTVTNASGLLSAAHADRAYLLIQNKDVSGNIYISFDVAATVAAGMQIPPGGAYEINANSTNSAIYAIGDIASNANIVVVEG